MTSDTPQHPRQNNYGVRILRLPTATPKQGSNSSAALSGGDATLHALG